VEGDVNPLRDMEIIQTELRLKNIEWVEKILDGLKKSGRSLLFFSDLILSQGTAEKVLKTLTVDAKDVRKADWSNKEVSTPQMIQYLSSIHYDEKEHYARNPARRRGSNAPNNS
jgi:obg-like ATPase 1